MTASISPEVRALMRPAAAALEPYDPAFKPTRINLSANENTYPMPPAVRTAIDAALAATPTNRYPVALSDELRSAIAEWHGVSADRVIVGNGWDELLFNLFLAFGGPGRPLVTCPPTFSVYDLYAGLVDTPVTSVERDPDTYELDVDAVVEAARTANLVIVTTPNNPTGGLFPHEGIARVCEACPGIVLADEAYIEFGGEGASCEGLLDTYDNLAVLHTMSKAFQMAGVRLGYVLADPSVVAALAAVRQPYSVNVLSQAAALVGVRMRDEFAPSIARIVSERSRLAAGLDRLAPLGVRTWPSAANFLLVRLPNAAQVRARLRDECSILVRDFSSTPGLADCLRVTVGTPEENDEVVAAITSILSEA